MGGFCHEVLRVLESAVCGIWKSLAAAAALSPPRRIPVQLCDLTFPTGGSYHGSRPTLQYK